MVKFGEHIHFMIRKLLRMSLILNNLRLKRRFHTFTGVCPMDNHMLRLHVGLVQTSTLMLLLHYKMHGIRENGGALQVSNGASASLVSVKFLCLGMQKSYYLYVNRYREYDMKSARV